jgi:predicted aspartyl protease
MLDEENAMGRTQVDVEVENYDDIALRKAAGNGHRKVRKVKVRALADTGSALLCLHQDTIRALGLGNVKVSRVRTANGDVDRRIYGPVRITILGRQCFGEIMEIPDKVSPLLGYIPLENLDLVVDPKKRKVIPNPESGGKYTLDLL